MSSRTTRVTQRTPVCRGEGEGRVDLKNGSHVYHTKFQCTEEALGEHEPSKLMERQRKVQNPGAFLAVLKKSPTFNSFQFYIWIFD